MNEGQMIVQMPIGAPLAVAMPASSAVTAAPQETQSSDVFSTVLQGMSPGATGELIPDEAALLTQPADFSGRSGTDLLMAQADILPAAMAGLRVAGSEEETEVPAVLPKGEEAPEQPEQGNDQNPQNVVLSAAGIQMITAQQIDGRMPELVVSAAEEQVSGERSARRAEMLESLRGVVPMNGTPLSGAPAVQSPFSTGNAVVSDELKAPGNPADVTAGRGYASQVTTVQSSTIVEGLADSYEIPAPVIRQGTAASAIQPSTTQPPVSLAAGRTNPVSMSVDSVATITTPGQDTMTERNTSADSVPQSNNTGSTRSMVRPILDAYLQTSVVPSGGGVVETTPAKQTMGPLSQADATSNDVQAALAGRTQAEEVLRADLPPVKAPTPQGNRVETVEGLTPRNESMLATTMSTDSGESFDQEGHGAFNPQTELQNHMMQLKAEHTQVAASATGGASETGISDVVKQVVVQVREHLAGREIKNGAEQVVIRLSPENLGELRLNLRMENQCLRVEIVAENSTVRDTLIKHSDTLKESLASQNITMESFDVSTGSNRNGSPSYGQNHAEWQELARQRQDAAWQSSGGYRQTSTPAILKNPVYLASAEHSMLDVHF